MPRFQITNYDATQLAQMITPQSGTDLEALPWILFYTDTTSFASAATSVQSVFFQTVQSDKTISNIEAPGQLPIPQVLEVAGNTCDILATPSANASNTAGALSDIANILKTVRSTFVFLLSNKSYGIFPLTCAHATGGEIGYMASTVATSNAQYANNGIFDGGWWVDGAIIIPSQQQFQVTVATSATALTLTQTPMPVRFGLWGPIHRRIL